MEKREREHEREVGVGGRGEERAFSARSPPLRFTHTSPRGGPSIPAHASLITHRHRLARLLGDDGEGVWEGEGWEEGEWRGMAAAGEGGAPFSSLRRPAHSAPVHPKLRPLALPPGCDVGTSTAPHPGKQHGGQISRRRRAQVQATPILSPPSACTSLKNSLSISRAVASFTSPPAASRACMISSSVRADWPHASRMASSWRWVRGPPPPPSGAPAPPSAGLGLARPAPPPRPPSRRGWLVAVVMCWWCWGWWCCGEGMCAVVVRRSPREKIIRSEDGGVGARPCQKKPAPCTQHSYYILMQRPRCHQHVPPPPPPQSPPPQPALF